MYKMPMKRKLSFIMKICDKRLLNIVVKIVNYSLGHKPIRAQYTDHVDSIVNGNNEHLRGLISRH